MCGEQESLQGSSQIEGRWHCPDQMGVSGSQNGAGGVRDGRGVTITG